MFRHDHAGLKELTHNALRIVAGFLFMQHGAQKLFGALGGNQVESLMSAVGIAGILEFFGGLLMMAGLLTGPVAFLLAGQMAVAYFWRHAPGGFWPIMNRGELAAFYSFTWLYFFATGPGKFSVDGWLVSRKAE
ncbi:MAG: DoxX family protein [Gemmatimonadetes bacterium]|nr:DoxX family protein [Gemmatimonadota bacterium]MXX35536.1 DoxX family protein [Gemmatimonadota bacterium]MYA12550.1 DoxX family protein [Gemmatimonadota bacterium]MYD14119.1 DoxX family protein [Gemmatimonadota bacterium]MYE71095.1 DoxX family protein [Gemmatimonadota bacterium]